MRIVCLLLAFSVVDTAAFAFTRSNLQKHWYLEACHNRLNAVAANQQQSSRFSEASASDEQLNPAVDFRMIQGRKKQTMGTAALIASIILATTIGGPAFADEYGVEKEAPTLFTGETVEICTKRGPLGACLKTEMRTTDNDNDVSKKYFRDPSTIIQQQKVAVLQKTDQDNDDGNALIQKLRQQSVDNREKNDLYVARKTFEADQSATFGPFDRQVLIMNTDGRTYTLLENPVAMRLKKAGFIDDRRSFITQPTQEDLDAASEKEPGFFSNLMGGGNN